MAKWLEEHTELIKGLINNREDFSITEIMELTGTSIRHSRKTIKDISVEMGVKLVNLYSANEQAAIYVLENSGEREKRVKEHKSLASMVNSPPKGVKPKSKQKYKCLCKNEDGNSIWLSTTSISKENAKKEMLRNPWVPSVTVYTVEEYRGSRKNTKPVGREFV